MDKLKTVLVSPSPPPQVSILSRTLYSTVWTTDKMETCCLLLKNLFHSKRKVRLK